MRRDEIKREVVEAVRRGCRTQQEIYYATRASMTGIRGAIRELEEEGAIRRRKAGRKKIISLVKR